MKRQLFIVLSLILVVVGTFSMAEETTEQSLLLPVKVLLLPKFEIGEMAGDFPGEAQYYYDVIPRYCGEPRSPVTITGKANTDT